MLCSQNLNKFLNANRIKARNIVTTTNKGKNTFWKQYRYYTNQTIPLYPVLDTADVYLVFSPVNLFGMNQYLLGCKTTGDAALIDCGDPAAQRWINMAAEKKLSIKHLLQTHAHIDHICGLKATKDALPKAPIYLHPGELVWYNTTEIQSRQFGMPCAQPPPPDVELKDNDVVKVGSIEMVALHVPGHCPGQICFYSKQHGFAICGDLLFQGSIGRTDFPYCSHKAMINSLKRIVKLPDSTIVCPGHMATTTIGEEKQTNEFLLHMS